MASKTVRQLREDVTARILTLTGWKESRVAPDNFGRDADSIARGRPAEGLLVETTLEVRYSWRLAPKGMSDSYDDALDGEAAVVNVLMAYDATWPSSYKVQLISTTRETSVLGEWVVGVITFRIVHTLPLQ